MKKYLLPGLALFMLGLVIAWMANLFNTRVEPGLTTVTPEALSQAVTVELERIPVIETIPGTITAKQATDISSRILARIESIAVRSGDVVNKGDLLVQLEQTDLISRKQQAEERIRGIEARLGEASLQLKRVEELLNQGMIARAELDRAKANQQALLAEQSAAREVLQEMETSLAYSRITAPIDGRIVDRYAEPGDTASPGMRLLSLYNPLSLRIEAHVREQLALNLKVGDELDIEIPALNQSMKGVVEELVPAANPGARSFQIKVSMDYAADLLPGMFARLKFVVDQHERLLIPFDRLARAGQLDIVWVYQDGRVIKRIVKTGKRSGDKIEILGGLRASDKIMPLPEQ
ncbi:MAG: efflux RND transporter periplasmic adaptor subunit [Pseudomonadales bacterium]|nr:efflux RND transporter periplasmic adaptor subunit [Pseudomonadales bacterium]